MPHFPEASLTSAPAVSPACSPRRGGMALLNLLRWAGRASREGGTEQSNRQGCREPLTVTRAPTHTQRPSTQMVSPGP